MAAGIAAAHERRAHPHGAGEPAMRRDITDADADAAMRGAVRRRAVAAQRVVQREAAGPQRHHLAVALVETLDDRLAAAVDPVLEAERGMVQLLRPPAR